MAQRRKERPPGGYARAEARNAEVRAAIEPLGPGERPRALVVACVVAVGLCVANIVGALVGSSVNVSWFGTAVFCALMLVAAAGMWQRQVWAVLGFEAMLGITIAFASLGLLVAANLLAVVVCVTVIGSAGTLFWKLVRVLGRLQAPPREPALEVPR